jgi:hypothetical protein
MLITGSHYLPKNPPTHLNVTLNVSSTGWRKTGWVVIFGYAAAKTIFHVMMLNIAGLGGYHPALLRRPITNAATNRLIRSDGCLSRLPPGRQAKPKDSRHKHGRRQAPGAGGADDERLQERQVDRK